MLVGGPPPGERHPRPAQAVLCVPRGSYLQALTSESRWPTCRHVLNPLMDTDPPRVWQTLCFSSVPACPAVGWEMERGKKKVESEETFDMYPSERFHDLRTLWRVRKVCFHSFRWRRLVYGFGMSLSQHKCRLKLDFVIDLLLIRHEVL